MKVKYCLVFLCSLFALNAMADAFPKLNTRSDIEFWKDGKRLVSIDSILFITTSGSNEAITDTLYIDKAFQGIDKNKLWEHNGIIRISLPTKIDTYRIVLIFNEKEYTSQQLEFKGVRNLFRFTLSKDGTIEDNHPLFFAKWLDYFKSLGITILLELLLALVLLRNAKVGRIHLLVLIIAANLITHPLLWYIGSHFNLGSLFLETAVFIVEALFLSYFLREKAKTSTVLIYALIANLVSWSLGTILYWVFL